MLHTNALGQKVAPFGKRTSVPQPRNSAADKTPHHVSCDPAATPSERAKIFLTDFCAAYAEGSREHAYLQGAINLAQPGAPQEIQENRSQIVQYFRMTKGKDAPTEQLQRSLDDLETPFSLPPAPQRQRE